MSAPNKNLWRHRDFLKLWSAQTASVFGSQIASLAYPLTAIIVLEASAFQVGMLHATGTAAAAMVGLFAGVLADRVRRKPLLIAADCGRAMLALTIPVAAFCGVLRIEQLYIVAFFTGALNILADVAGMSFLPSLLEKQQLVEGNSKLGTTESVALIAGPGLSGLLVQIFTAPFAILIDAASFLLSAVFVRQIRAPEIAPAGREKLKLRAEIAEGLRFVYGNAILRPLAESIALYFLFRQIVLTLFTLYAVRELNLEPFLLGVIFSALGFGFLLGALSVKSITARFGVGRAMIGANLINILALALVPLASGSVIFVAALLALSHFLHAFAVQINGINLMSLRQAITPAPLQGRMNASFRFVNMGTMMTGALVAGSLGELIGLRATLVIGAIGMLLPFLRLLFSPVRRLETLDNS
ncbi:MAG TPA: MFS transporter [Pyrinomonadaceae bacterium]|nr:MFS transporter [Pyrinomonadaceae bacterium]